jgi:hypothetical protein
MTIVIEEQKYTEEEKTEFRKNCICLKEQIKELAEIQKKEKALLRSPHHLLPSTEVELWNGSKIAKRGSDLAGDLMYACLGRSRRINDLHVQYNKLRGKPYDMHEYKN